MKSVFAVLNIQAVTATGTAGRKTVISACGMSDSPGRFRLPE